MRKKLFSVTKKDFRIDTFRSGGPGGQNQNKVSSGVRITHTASGISAESRESRSQEENKKIAFNRLAKDRKFLAWISDKAMDLEKVEKSIDRAMDESNLRVEIKDDGRWIEWK